MQTTATAQVTSAISSEPVGKAEKRKKWKLVASGDTRENCTYPLDDHHYVTSLTKSPLEDQIHHHVPLFGFRKLLEKQLTKNLNNSQLFD